jgi:hypothetical protein
MKKEQQQGWAVTDEEKVEVQVFGGMLEQLQSVGER